VEKIIRENTGEKQLSVALRERKVSEATIFLLSSFMGEIDRRLISQCPYLRVKTHDRGLTYFPSIHNKPKAFWINFSQNWFTIAYTEGGKEFSKQVHRENLEEMLNFAEKLFLKSLGQL
jgi:hypothetical protein